MPAQPVSQRRGSPAFPDRHPSGRFRDELGWIAALVLGVLLLTVAVCVGFWARCVWRRAARRAREEEARCEATISGLRRELAEVRREAKAQLRHERAEAQRLRPAEVGLVCGESGKAASDDEAEGGAADATVAWGDLPLEMTRLFGSWAGGDSSGKRVSFAAAHYFQGGSLSKV